MVKNNLKTTANHILGIDLLPAQVLILNEIGNKKFPMLIAKRDFEKSFMLSLYAVLRALILPRRKIVIVGDTFRRSKVIFEHMETIWHNSPVLRDICDADSGPCRDTDRCVLRLNESTITCLPLGDGQKIRGQRANDIFVNEFASIPIEIFENVVAGFPSVSADPKESKSDNQTVLSATSHYGLNRSPFWKKWKSIVKSQGNMQKLREIFNGKNPPENFDWKQYSIKFLNK